LVLENIPGSGKTPPNARSLILYELISDEYPDMLPYAKRNGINVNHELTALSKGWTLLHEVFLRALEDMFYGNNGAGKDQPDQSFLDLLRTMIQNGAELINVELRIRGD